MSKDKIPTAMELSKSVRQEIKEHFHKMATDLEYREKYNSQDPQEFVGIYEKRFIQWCQSHVEAALKAASETVKVESKLHSIRGGQGVFTGWEVDKDSILNAYSLDNIK